jgi:hypothetical protein
MMQLGHPQSAVLPTRSISFQEKRQGQFPGDDALYETY